MRARARVLAAGLMVAGAVIAASPAALAATGVTIKSGGCAGGGSLFCYSPESASSAAGTTVTWANQSGAPHTITICDATNCPGAPKSSGSNTFDLSVGAANGSTASFTFTSAGTYVYYCKIHGYAAMHGAITISSTTPSQPTPSSAPSSRGGAVTPPVANTGAGLGWTLLLVPLGVLLLALGLVLRRR